MVDDESNRTRWTDNWTVGDSQPFNQTEDNMSCARDEDAAHISPIVLIIIIMTIGCFGIFLNSIVIAGVRSNPKLTTSINKLLVWICGFCILEGSLGVSVKAIILGGLVSDYVRRPNITVVCKSLLSLPFMFSNGTQLLWTFISLYRLYLVVRSVRGSPPPSKAVRTMITRLMPLLAVVLAALTAILGSLWSDPFLIYRLCRGECDSFDKEMEYIAIYYQIVPAVIFYLPAGISYAIIFLLVNKASQARRERAQFSQSSGRHLPIITADPASRFTSALEQESGIVTTPVRRRPFLPSFSVDSASPITITKRNQDSIRRQESAPSSPIQPRFKRFLSTGERKLPIIQMRPLVSREIPVNIQPRASTVSCITLAERRINSRNVISAKLSFLFLLLMFSAGFLLTITYNQVNIIQEWSIETRVFINCLFIDMMLVVISPLLLLYSSHELRKSIREMNIAGCCCEHNGN